MLLNSKNKNPSFSVITEIGLPQTISKFIGSIQSTANSAKNIFTEFSKSATKMFETIAKAIDQYIDELDKFYLLLAEAAWPPPSNYLPFAKKAHQLARDYLNGTKPTIEKIDKIMIDWHSDETVQKMLENWREVSWLSQRWHIIELAIQAHLRGEYVLSIPVLLAQVEGIIANNHNYSGWMSGKEWQRQFESLLHEALVLKGKNNAMRNFVTEILLANFVHGNSIPTSPNRHAILHGADTQYGTKANSLKLILLIENLIDLFRLESIEGSSVFHVNGCSVLRRSLKKRQFYATAQEAIRDGLQGCKRCKAVNHLW